ncbi:MAG: phosphoadenosine phosphosulfate reductase family protein [Desulfurococcus sp.]
MGNDVIIDDGWVCWDNKRNAPRLNCRKWRMRHDYWLAGSFEKRLVEELILAEFKIHYRLQDRNVLIHRAPNPSSRSMLTLEVFADGVRLGVVEYRIGEKWMIHPSGGLASLLNSLGAYSVEAEPGYGRWLKGKKVKVVGDINGLRWILLDLDKYVGVARVIDASKKLVKVKDVAPKGFKPLPATGIIQVVEANRSLLETAINEAVGFLKKTLENVTDGIAVSYSGGADSTASLVLSQEALGHARIKVVYVDTGMDLPGVKEYALRILDKLGLTPHVVSSGLDPLNEIASRGLPTRDNRWCTRILKLEPLRRFYREHDIRFVIDGSRSRESSSRAETPRISRNPLIPEVTRILPIKWWSRLLVQLYLVNKGIELNPLYDEGFTRLGCILCPAMHPHELELSYTKHRYWFERLREVTGLSINDVMMYFYSEKEKQ